MSMATTLSAVYTALAPDTMNLKRSDELDRLAENSARNHRTQRLKLYLEAILADHIAHHGIPETRRLLRWWDDHLKEFG